MMQTMLPMRNPSMVSIDQVMQMMQVMHMMRAMRMVIGNYPMQISTGGYQVTNDDTDDAGVGRQTNALDSGDVDSDHANYVW